MTTKKEMLKQLIKEVKLFENEILGSDNQPIKTKQADPLDQILHYLEGEISQVDKSIETVQTKINQVQQSVKDLKSLEKKKLDLKSLYEKFIKNERAGSVELYKKYWTQVPNEIRAAAASLVGHY